MSKSLFNAKPCACCGLDLTRFRGQAVVFVS